MGGDIPNLGALYNAEKLLGKGAEGSVWQGKYVGHERKGCLEQGTSVAIKLVAWENVRPNEVMMQAQLRHLNIVTLYDVFEPPDGGLALVLELANYEAYHLKGPSLWDSIQTQVGKNMEVRVYKTRPETIDGVPQFKSLLTGGEAMCRWIFLQVATALDYCHRHPRAFCNRDVKPENVLIVRFGSHADGVLRPIVKLADFGFCRATDQSAARTRLGTPNYAAPEVIRYETASDTGYDGPKADVWSAGALLYLLATGVEAFKEREDLDLLKKKPGQEPYQWVLMRRIAGGEYVPTLERHMSHCSPELKDLLSGMLHRNPAKRLTMHQVLHHEWSKKLDYDILATDKSGTRLYIKCWQTLMLHVEAGVAKTKRAAEKQDPKNPAPCDWTLPYPVSEVEAMLKKHCKAWPDAAERTTPHRSKGSSDSRCD